MNGIEEKSLFYRNNITVFHKVAAKGWDKVCKSIMDEIEDKNPKDDLGYTPMDLGLKFGHENVCIAILNEIEEIIPKYHEGDMTVLHEVAKIGWNKACQLIVDKIDDVNLKGMLMLSFLVLGKNMAF